MKSGALIIFALSLTLVVVIYLRKGSPPEQTSGKTESQAAAEPGQPEPPQTPENKGTTFARPPLSEANDPGQYFDPALMEENPVYVARVVKHLDLRYYESSPAKNTPECLQIVELLRRYGAGLDAVGDAYNAAYDRAQIEALIARSGNPDPAGDPTAKMMRNRADDRLARKYGLSDPAFLESLYQIRPTVFFGQKDLNRPAPGEKLLE